MVRSPGSPSGSPCACLRWPPRPLSWSICCVRTSSRPSVNSVLGGVMAFVIANWAPHVIAPFEKRGRRDHDGLRPCGTDQCPCLAVLDVRRRAHGLLCRAERPVCQARPNHGDDRGNRARGGVHRPSGKLHDPNAVAGRAAARHLTAFVPYRLHKGADTGATRSAPGGPAQAMAQPESEQDDRRGDWRVTLCGCRLARRDGRGRVAFSAYPSGAGASPWRLACSSGWPPSLAT